MHLSDLLSALCCKSCRWYRGMLGRTYGICIRGGLDVVMRRGRWPMRCAWFPRCRHLEQHTHTPE